MTNEKMFLYILDTCCETRKDVDLAIIWIQEVGLSSVYEHVHYMFDEDNHIK